MPSVQFVLNFDNVSPEKIEKFLDELKCQIEIAGGDLECVVVGEEPLVKPTLPPDAKKLKPVRRYTGFQQRKFGGKPPGGFG